MNFSTLNKNLQSIQNSIGEAQFEIQKLISELYSEVNTNFQISVVERHNVLRYRLINYIYNNLETVTPNASDLDCLNTFKYGLNQTFIDNYIDFLKKYNYSEYDYEHGNMDEIEFAYESIIYAIDHNESFFHLDPNDEKYNSFKRNFSNSIGDFFKFHNWDQENYEI